MSDNKQNIYPQTAASPDFATIEAKISKFWQDEKIFEKSVDKLPKKQDGGKEFSFFDGPPFANGLPHYGHLLTSSVKDIYARYHTMKGERTERVFGWDCHGLPAEMAAEKELGIQGQLAIQDYGIEKFNDTCRTSVMKYTQEWQDYVNRLGRWVDFENGYKTMDRNYMESVMWAFSELHKKGLIYEGHKVMPYSWAAETPLSNFETRMDNAYREKVSKAATVAFELEEVPNLIKDGYDYNKHPISKCYFLAWTTTPWTLPSNLALTYGASIQYVVSKANENDDFAYITSLNYAQQNNLIILNEPDTESPFIINSIFREKLQGRRQSGEQRVLIGLRYKPLFPYFAGDEYAKQRGEKAFTILEGDFVSDADGTGIVHLAPGFGEDDQRVCEENNICMPKNGGIICPVDHAGKFTNEIFDIEGETPISLKGLNVMKATEKCDAEPYTDAQMEKYGLVNLRILQYLKLKNQLIKQDDYTHNYPHCWRTDTPLIYKAVPSWYVEVTKFKDRMVELNQKINWTPEHVKDGQFGKWLENAHDWAISRNRFWGAPIPVWKTESGKMKVFGSIAELEEFFGVEVPDLHRPFIDTLEKKDEETGETYKRVAEVLDCWFESGSMPFAELHYPFENKNKFDSRFPADFIVEYTAQTRGWFYTLMVLSTALFDEIPFKNCICHGVILGEPAKNPSTGKMEKQKLSKRLRNYPDPLEVFNTLGADAMRYYMTASPVMNGGELTVAKDGSDIKDVVRLVIKPIWNAYHFFTLYANSDGVKAEERFDSENLMDKYILAKLKDAVVKIDNSLKNYDTQTACKALEDFFEVMNNWYIRRSRERFWRSSDASQDADKKAAYDTLYTCLVNISEAGSPIMPFIFEEIFKNLTGAESVHLQNFPALNEIKEDKNLITSMDKVRDICNTGLSIRNAENVRIRQPIAKAQIFGGGGIEFLENYKDIIADELNIKAVEISQNLVDKAELKLKINFPVLGKRLPEKMKQIIPASKKGEWKQLEDGRIEILGEVLTNEECELLLEPKNPQGAAPLSSNDALVILDLEITEELKNEGIARDVVRMIQQARKDADLNISDKINLSIEANEEIQAAVKANKSYIEEQTLSFINNSYSNEGFVASAEVEGSEVKIAFSVNAKAA